MSLKHFLLSTLVLLSLLTPALVSAQEPPTDPQAVAQAMIDNMIAGDFEAATENFAPDMLAALPATALEETWNALQDQVGAFQQQVSVTTQEIAPYVDVIITLQFEQALLDLHIGLTTDGQIVGLHIQPSQTTPTPTYEPPAYADAGAFEERDMILNQGTEWELPGTLTIPTGDGPFPAVVLVHGSGPNNRDESIGPNKPFRDLAEGLASRGIAVLRYDKRTLVHGQAMVASGELTINEETVDDALAAVALLRTTEGIDPNRIFVIGHSQGAYMAPRIGQRDPQIAGLILLAGNSRSLLVLVPEQSEYLASLDGTITSDEQAALDNLKIVVAATQNVQPGDDPSTLLFNAPAVYWIDLNAYDPVAVAAEISTPMLILQGERDYQVTMVDFAGWQAGLAGRDNVTFKSYPGLTHLFITGEGPGNPAEYNIPGHVDETVVQDIADWILDR